MNAASTQDDEPSEPGFVLTGAKGALVGFALASLLLAAGYLVVGGREEPQEKGQASSYVHTMPSLSSLREAEATRPERPTDPAKVEKRAPSTAPALAPAPAPAPPLAPAPAARPSPAPDPPAAAPAGKPLAELTPPAQPPAQAKPEVPVAAPTKPSKKPGTREEKRGPWVINVASVQSKANAQQTLDLLKKGGYDAYIDEAQQNGNLWHRVRVGFFPSREEARRAAEELSHKYGIQGPWLAQQPKE